MTRHATTQTWDFPPSERALPAPTVNLRELAARPGRFEHHLMVIGNVGTAQIELVTASEPLFFSHANISDEYAMALPTGDPLLDGFPLRTFLSSREDGSLVGRINHRVGQMVLHPHGWLHWPGMLRPPYDPPAFPGPRRCGLSVVFCASTPTPPATRPLEVSPGLEDAVKAYAGSPPFHVVESLQAEEATWLGQVAEARMDLLVDPDHLESRGYLLVLDATESSPWFPCDFAHITTDLPATGIRRALWFSGPDVSPPPASWHQTPTSPLPPFEDGDRASLPTEIHGSDGSISATEAPNGRVLLRIGNLEKAIPRYWLARMLFRIALHDYALGYLETYEGFFYDDQDGFTLGLREGSTRTTAHFDRQGIENAISRLYARIPPANYTERLT